jgi:hypothetical protein
MGWWWSRHTWCSYHKRYKWALHNEFQ